MADAASKVKIGPGMDPATQLGPLVSQEQLDRVTGFLREGLTDGARALTGGQRWGDKGFFVEPTVLVDVRPEFSVVREEIFGPVVSAMPFDAEDGVEVAANDSIYGLAAGIWTRDLSKAHRTARRLKPDRCGSTSTTASTPPCPSAGSSSRAGVANSARARSTSTRRPKP